MLALARSGATIQARRRYDSFGLASVEGASIAARLAEDIAALDARLDKDIALARDGEQRRLWASRSARGYGAAFDRHRSPYLAVNAATMWLVAGEEVRATASARQGLDVLSKAKAASSEDRYWLLASEAEAALVLGDRQRAEDALGRAGHGSESALASRATTLRQLRLVCELKGFDPSLLAAIANPTVVHFCGHRIGAPGEGSRFPAEEEPRVQAELKAEFDRLGAGIGYGSLAAGADIMAAEVLLDRGAELHVTLPFDREEFVRTSVAPAGPAWVRRFERCLASAAAVVIAVHGEYLDDPTLFDFCARIAMGDALVQGATARGRRLPGSRMGRRRNEPDGRHLGRCRPLEGWRTPGHDHSGGCHGRRLPTVPPPHPNGRSGRYFSPTSPASPAFPTPRCCSSRRR